VTIRKKQQGVALAACVIMGVLLGVLSPYLLTALEWVGEVLQALWWAFLLAPL
jgi:hypothetical protein